MALDTSMRGPQQAPVRSEADGLPPSAAFSARWTETFLALLHDLRVDEEGAPSLERIATILVRHGARLVPGSECVISIVPPERPGSFSVLAGEGAWASTLRGREWPLEGTLNGRAMLGGMPVESTDAQAESATPEVLAPGDIESGRVVPLRLRELPADGRVTMGAIGFWRTGHRPYDDEERALIDTYGELSTALLHRAELLGAATRTARRLESAVELAVETSASLEPEPVIRRLLERSLDAVAADRASLCRIDGTVMTVVDIVDRERMVHGAVGRHEQPWHPAVARAVEERRPVAVGRIEEADLRGAWREGLRDVERSLFAPLVAEGEVVALLTLMRRADVPFTDADVSTVQLIGNIAALSLRNAERYAESRRAHERSLLALLEIARHVDDTNELSDFFGRLTESVARLVHARGAAFFALEADGSLRLVERAHNVDTGVAASGQRVVLHRGTAPWRVTLDGEHIRDDTGASAAEWLPGLDASSVIAGPWRAGERLLGSVIAFDTTTASGFSDEDVWVLRIAALAAGLVVSHQETAARELQLVREARERVHEISVVQDAAQALSMAIEIEDVYREIVRSAAHVVTPPASLPRRATLLKVEEDAAVIVAEYDEAGQHTRQEKFDLGEHPALRQVVERGATVVIDLSAGDVAEPTARQMRDMGVRSSALAPVRVDDTIVAILRVSAREESGFEPVHLERLTAIANVAALAIGNAGRYRSAQREAMRRTELENVKSEFLRLASHELRGPIGLLRGYLSMFEDGTVTSVSGQARETLPILQAKLAQMSRMVDDMLETARLEEGHLRLRFEVTDLRALVVRAVETVSPLATTGHTIDIQVPPVPVHVSADVSSVETILTNLLDNAIKYSPDGGVIECALSVDGNDALVAVHDRGLGIAEDDLPRLFAKFGRILTPQNSHIAGTGLGLHLARQLAHLHGGEITVSSRPQEGSVFTLQLPLLQAANEA